MRTLTSVVTALAVLPFAGCGRGPASISPVDEVSPAADRGDALQPGVKATAYEPTEGDWPWWRGPGFNGAAAEQQVPTRWGKDENVVWKSPIVGKGYSSPAVVGDRLFVTSADETARTQVVIGYDRETGNQLWQTVAHSGGFARKHNKNSHASASAACDGKHVYVPFLHDDALWVTATDLDGNIVWQEQAGPFASEHGYGSSPVLHKGLVIVAGDNLSGSFIAALECASGKVHWRTRRATTGVHGSFGTPIIGQVAGKLQLLLMGMNSVSSYDPDTGKLLWTCDGPAEVTACTVAHSDDLVFATGGYPEKQLFAVRADGSGDVTGSHIVWRTSKGVTYVPSPIFHDGHLYVVADNGSAACFEAETGELRWQGRLRGAFSASPILCGDNLYVPNEAGKLYVFNANPEKFNIVAENDLGDGGFASPVICGGQIFLRTNSWVYCIGEPANQTALRD